MEDLFRHVAGPLRRLWDAIQDADDRSWEAHRRQVHNELKEEEAKPPGTRDELLHEELTERSLELDMEDLQRQRAWRETQARRFGFPPSHECCNATAWTWRRAAASYRAQAAFYRPLVAQADEDYFAALYRFRRKEWLDRTDPPQLLAPPVWRLKLGEELRHVPPVLDTCAACRRLTEQLEQEEQRLQAWSVELAEGYRRRALLAAPIATNTCPGSSVALLAAAAELPQTAAQQTAGTAAGRDSEAEVP